MSVSQSHACFSETIISTLEKLVAIVKRLYMVTLVSVSFTHSDSRILVEELLQQKKRPNLLLLCCTFLPSWEQAAVSSPGGYHSKQFCEAEYKVRQKNSRWKKNDRPPCNFRNTIVATYVRFVIFLNWSETSDL